MAQARFCGVWRGFAKETGASPLPGVASAPRGDMPISPRGFPATGGGISRPAYHPS
nr:MAG TPA: hypothetical protein [Caudoviricetes sp.]